MNKIRLPFRFDLLPRYFFVAVVLVLGLAVSPALAGGTDPYLIRPQELPADCHQIPGFYPLTEKIRIFYEYKMYQPVLPKVTDRHAQSFECGSSKGSLYYFAYATVADREASERFARPVLGHTTPAPQILPWKTGFVVVSFAQPPAALTEVLQKKLSGEGVPATAVSEVPKSSATARIAPSTSTFKVSTPASLPAAAPGLPSVSVPSPARTRPSSVDVRSPITIGASSAPATSSATAMATSPTPVPAAVPAPASEPDVSDALVPGLAKAMGCKDKDLPSEAREICALLESFRRGKPFEPVVESSAAAIGVAYRVDSYGRLEERYYNVAVGSGRPWEISLFPIRAFSGVEDFESQAIIDSRRTGHALPKNEILDRIMKHPRPTRASIFPTPGRSLMMPTADGKKVYFRQEGKRWILLGVEGKSLEQQLRSGFAIAELY